MHNRRIKFILIKESKVELSVSRRCEVLGINRSSFYKWLNSSFEYDNTIDKLVVEIFNEHKGTYGRKRITIELNLRGYTVNHKRVYRIMCEQGLKAKVRRKWKAGKYKKHHTYENILNREFESESPNKKYVSDVTQLRSINDKKYYFYPIVDLYNNEIKEYSVHYHNDNSLVKSVLDIINLSGVEIMHSDQGAQFTSYMYTEELSKYEGLQISMSHVGDCYDNAQMESIFGHIKDDFYLFYNPQSEEELYDNLKQYVKYYNEKRIQIKLKMSPVQYRTQNA